MAFFMHFYGLKKLAWLSLFMHKYTKNAGIVLFYTQNPAYLAAPVSLELTTHGSTGSKFTT